jgi:hypothetical protein
MRSRLRRVAEALIPASELDPAGERPMGPADPSAPYADQEVTTLWSNEGIVRQLNIWPQGWRE